MAKAKIMVVEDEGIVALSIQRKLKYLGYDVPIVAATGEEAIKQAELVSPNLVLMDIMLDGRMDGVEAAAYIRARFDIPVIYLTANSDEITLQRAKITQPFGYLLKPFEARELHTAIEMALYKHQMEAKLKESERWLGTTLKSIGDAVIATDAEGRIKFMNPVAEALTGWPEVEALGNELPNVFQICNEQCGAPIENPVMKLLREGQPVNLITPPLLLSKTGTTRLIEATISPIKDNSYAINGVVVVFRDITERRQAELAVQKAKAELEIRVAERTEELSKANAQLQLELAERKRVNTELEQFAYVASHDLREPLRKIKSYTELLERRYKDQLDEKADKYINYIVDGVARMQMLVTDLLAYSRTGRSELRLEPTNLNEVLKQVVGDLEVAIRDGNAMVTYDTLPTLVVDASQMAQLFQNLIGNAIKFHGQDTPRVHVGVEKVDSGWVFGVRDNGIGIEPEYAERIFLIFQRLHTRSEYPGSGIGLAICKRVVERHGGRIWVESEPGKGTTFYFVIPEINVGKAYGYDQ
jgi:PAS domain S-box-containing protein